MLIRRGQTKQCNWLCGLSSVPPGTSGDKPGHLGVPKTTFGIPGQNVPNRDCPGKTGTVGQLDPNAVVSIEAVAYSFFCNTVEWFWWDWSQFQWLTGFLQCFYTIVWVIWPVKSSPKWPIKCRVKLSLYWLRRVWPHGTQNRHAFT